MNTMETSTEPRRRLSVLRLLLALTVTGAIVAGALVGWHIYSAAATDKAGNAWFAGYADVTATPRFAFETAATTSAKNVVLSFIVASPDSPCAPSWGAAYSLSQASASLDLDRRIARLRQQGGEIAISFGGQKNEELATACTSVSSLAAAYTSVIDRYDLTTIDMDLEGASLTDSAANERRFEALERVQKQRRDDHKPLAVWLTLPVSQTGLAVPGQDAVRTALLKKVDLAGVNVMTMDYGSSLTAGTSMLSASKQAVTEAQRQLSTLYQQTGTPISDATAWSKIGVTPMIGQNDDVGQVFSLSAAKALNSFATAKGVGRMSMWSLNRDLSCGSNYVTLSVVSDSCSGIAQRGARFSSVLGKQFTGNVSTLAKIVTTAEPVNPAALKDNPATSPYAIWSTGSSYLEGTKVVWHHNVYVAKWWTRSDLPDNPVLNSWETPWRLVGPVLPGEKPIVVPTLPEGTYAEWAGTTTYQKDDRVLFDGVPFQSKWWNQGDSPDAASSNPDGSPWVPLTITQINDIQAQLKTSK